MNNDNIITEENVSTGKNIKKNIVAVIPARGGSKGVPKKNLKLLNGKPLIVYTIEAAVKCKLINRVICSTDDEEIATIAKEFGAEVPFLRPKELSTDTAHTPPVIEHTVNYLEEKDGLKVDLVITLQPTSPLREHFHITEAINKFFQGDYDALISIKTGYPPWWMFKAEGDKLLPFASLGSGVNPYNLERQQLPPAYEVNGAIYITKRDFLKRENSIISKDNCGFIIMDQETSLDIDTLTDFMVVEEVMKKKTAAKLEDNQEVIKIGNNIISKDGPTFIIAEAGANHNKDMSLAKKLIDAAVESGVDAVKFQTFKSESVVTKNTGMAEYQEKNTGIKESQQEMLKKLELNFESFIELKKYCDQKGILFLSTPHSPEAIDFLDDLIPAYKIGSGDLTNLPFLEKIAKKNKPMILGTGMSTIEEIQEAVSAIKKIGNNQVILLHCTTSYPCPLENVNLNVLVTLKNKFNNIVGYSDHTISLDVPVVAVSMGAKVIEKHFTLDKNLPGPDHKASLNPSELKEMVLKIRNVEKYLGNYEKKPSEEEIEIAKIARKSIVAAKDIGCGEILTEDSLAIKRPGTGIKPKEIYSIVGQKSKFKIEKDTLISREMVEK